MGQRYRRPPQAAGCHCYRCYPLPRPDLGTLGRLPNNLLSRITNEDARPAVTAVPRAGGEWSGGYDGRARKKPNPVFEPVTFVSTVAAYPVRLRGGVALLPTL